MKSKDLIITKNPKSLFAESIRSIRTNIAFASLDKEVKIIINTSPEAGDGKSFITSNLANTYAQEGKNVLLIDADLRRGRLHEIFDVMNVTSGGYTNLMLNYKQNISLSKYIFPTFDKNIDLLVDDLYENIISCINEDVKVILFNKNKDYKGLKTTSWNKVYKMIMEDLC